MGHNTNYESRREELLDKKQSLERTKAELQKEAEGIDAIQKEQQELQEKLRRRADLDERRQELDGDIRQAIVQTPLILLAEPLCQIVEEQRAKLQPSPRREGHDARCRALAYLLDQDDCLCGREIDEDIRNRLRAEFGRIKALLESQPENAGAVSNDLLELSMLLKSIQSQDRDPEGLIDKRALVNTRLEELDTDIYRLKQALEGHESVDIGELYQQIGRLDSQTAEESHRLRSVDENLSRARSDLQQKQRELDKIGAGDEQARGVTRTLEETRRVSDAVSELVDRRVEQKRSAIETTAADVFRQITNKPDEYDCLRVIDDYTLEVVRKDGTIVEHSKLSAGEKEVVAYSFITALNLASNDPAPFVMDTPFGHLDSGHRAGLLRSLPKLRVQAILLATDRDLPAAERDAIDGSIIREFTLRRDQRQAVTTIEEN